MSSAYLSFDGIDLHFDAVTSETTTHTAKATTHPVENGPDISDHVQDELDTVTLEVMVTNAPIKDVNNAYGLDATGFEVLSADFKTPVRGPEKLDIPKYRPVPVTPGALMQTIGNAVRDLLSDDTVAQVYNKSEKQTLSAFAMVKKWPAKFNAITDVVGQLVKWKQAGMVGKVITPWKTFPSVVIENVSTSRAPDIGDAAKVSITFREIRLVESRLVNAPKATEPRATVAKPKGKEDTKPEPAKQKDSLITALVKRLSPSSTK